LNIIGYFRESRAERYTANSINAKTFITSKLNAVAAIFAPTRSLAFATV
jgi:hypothetical protein